MKLRVSDVWTWRGTIDRGPYVVMALLLFVLKFAIDRATAILFGQPWGFAEYLRLATLHVSVSDYSFDPWFLGALAVCSLPFLWAGLALTIKRLRATGLAPWMIVLFVVPILKFLFFLILALVPSRPEDGPGEASLGAGPSFIPRSAVGSAFAGILITAALAALGTWFGTTILLSYGWSVFVCLPFCAGFMSSMIYGYHHPRNLNACILIPVGSVAVAAVCIAAFAIEGLICIAMAAPLAGAFAVVGGLTAYCLQKSPFPRRDGTSLVCAMALVLPVAMGYERAASAPPPVFAVSSSVEIDAPPQRVWDHVVSFSEITARPSWIFRAGIACPVRARIDGNGVGAIRYCEFTTGPFVEPIEVWDEPRLLKFAVTENPLPMKELSPYRDLHPPHLDTFMTSEAGQFNLVALPGGRTRLEGTTWYHHGLWPTGYWRVWSDFIIHRIHLRVLVHIKQLAESDAARSAVGVVD